MTSNNFTIKLLFAAVLLFSVLLLSACQPSNWRVNGNESFAHYDSIGEQIFLTGVGADGRIDYTGGDFGGVIGNQGMMGTSRLVCADCHGLDARGKGPLMHMSLVGAPDIRWSTLAATAGDGHDDEDEHGMEHPPYDEQSFKRAVTEGVDPGSEALDPLMPRWQMSNKDLDALIRYLKQLD